tara:strand:- start:2672 stop:2809 length:138 start_codon:yes stop_codon:yes gene_type:complete
MERLPESIFKSPTGISRGVGYRKNSKDEKGDDWLATIMASLSRRF